MAVNVFLTIDVECGDYSHSYDGSVHGRLDSFSGRDYGLEHILRTFQEYGLAGTFFVEPFIASRLGMDGLEKICRMIQGYGQDIQLHIHPNLLENAGELGLAGNDLYAGLRKYSYDDQVRLIEHGKKILQSCGVEEIKAFRAGGFGADNTSLEALKANGIYMDSSYNLSYLQSSCGLYAKEGVLNDAAEINGVAEIPVTNYKVRYMPWVGPRHMQLGAVSLGEMKAVLESAAAGGLSSVCILFHSSEFIKFYDRERSSGTPDRINLNRLEQLCKYLADNKETFRVVSFSDYIGDNDGHGLPSREEVRLPLVSPLQWAGRMFQQIWKRVGY